MTTITDEDRSECTLLNHGSLTRALKLIGFWPPVPTHHFLPNSITYYAEQLSNLQVMAWRHSNSIYRRRTSTNADTKPALSSACSTIPNPTATNGILKEKDLANRADSVATPPPPIGTASSLPLPSSAITIPHSTNFPFPVSSASTSTGPNATPELHRYDIHWKCNAGRILKARIEATLKAMERPVTEELLDACRNNGLERGLSVRSGAQGVGVDGGSTEAAA
ncbi:hypothetical protein CC78DRAFT_288363 [Lojkania enalia]|uniref:Uncharacterized protein n=1 Tax=Lojkania enalia TaxID=147567 RepID=A0A9P4KAY9_9PLEO|nr:hypothetical protein CC78DRAFT_288363 [Didymosphaeria enalia]